MNRKRDPHSQRSLAERFGVSSTTIRNDERSALRKLERAIRSDPLLREIAEELLGRSIEAVADQGVKRD